MQMKTIRINDEEIKISHKTYKRIEQIASENKMSFSEAISFLLSKVKWPDLFYHKRSFDLAHKGDRDETENETERV